MKTSDEKCNWIPMLRSLRTERFLLTLYQFGVNSSSYLQLHTRITPNTDSFYAVDMSNSAIYIVQNKRYLKPFLHSKLL